MGRPSHGSSASSTRKRLRRGRGLHELDWDGSVRSTTNRNRQSTVSSYGGNPRSDHFETGTRNTVTRSVASGAPIIGDPGTSAPQAFASVSGTKNIKCGCQRPSRSLRWPSFDIMYHIAPISGVGNSPFSSAARMASAICVLDFPANASLLFAIIRGR